LKDAFKVVAKTFQQIMAELNGTEEKEDRIMAITIKQDGH
jgi:hypothetical protein